ncbi:MAG: caspase family protein [Parvibaculaceae bacterium]
MHLLLRALSVFCLAIVASLSARAENPPTPAPLLRIEAGMHTGPIYRSGISADGTLLATASVDKTVRLWSLPDGKLIRTFRIPISLGAGGALYAAAIDPTGRIIATGGWDGYWYENNGGHFVYLIDTVTGRIIRRLGPFDPVIGGIAFSPDGSRLAVGLRDGYGVKVWKAPFNGAPMEDKDYKGGIFGVAFDRENRLATTSEDKLLRFYDADLKLLVKQPSETGDEPFSVAFSPSGKEIAVGHIDTQAVHVLSIPDFKMIRQLDLSGMSGYDLHSVAWSPDGKTVYAAGRFGTEGIGNQVVAWSGPDMSERRMFAAAQDSLQDIDVTPAGEIVYVSSEPSFGVLDPDGKTITRREPVTVDMRYNRRDAFLIAPDASKVNTALRDTNGGKWILDLQKFVLSNIDAKPGDFVTPIIDTLPIKDWEDTLTPTLRGAPLPLWKYEISRSLAIAPDAHSFVLGTSWAIYRFNDKGEVLKRRPVVSNAWALNISADGLIIVAAHGDGTIRWYNRDLEEILALFIHAPDKRWIAWTPSGYYAASPGGEDLLGWHVNGRSWSDTPDFFPAGQFRNRFYRPDIVQMVLKTRDEARAIEQADIIAKREAEEGSVKALLPPVIDIVDPADGIETSAPYLTIRYRLRSPSGQKVERVEVLVDGLRTAARGLEDPGGETVDVPIPPRDCEIALIAIGETTNSAPAKIKIKWTGTEITVPQRKLHALLVGISDYDDQTLKLSYADDDARDFAALLKGQEGRLFSKVETRVLTDKQATRAEILNGFDWLINNAGENDYVVIFMAGHGVTDPRQRFYFIPVEASADPERLRATALPEGEIREAVQSLKKSRVLFFIDACRSGSALSGGADLTGFVNELSLAENGVVMFSSSTGRENSLERDEWKNGAFTEVLLDGLSGKANYERDREITTDEINLYLSKNVARLTNGAQNAVMVRPGTVKDFALAVVQ